MPDDGDAGAQAREDPSQLHFHRSTPDDRKVSWNLVQLQDDGGGQAAAPTLDIRWNPGPSRFRIRSCDAPDLPPGVDFALIGKGYVLERIVLPSISTKPTSSDTEAQ